MKTIFFRPVIFAAIIGVSFLGAFSALKFGELINQLSKGLYVLLICDAFFLFIGYKVVKNNTQVNITRILDYKTLFVFIVAFGFGFSVAIAALTLSSIIFIL